MDVTGSAFIEGVRVVDLVVLYFAIRIKFEGNRRVAVMFEFICGVDEDISEMDSLEPVDADVKV